jgi:ankyrin repeat protein
MFLSRKKHRDQAVALDKLRMLLIALKRDIGEDTLVKGHCFGLSFTQGYYRAIRQPEKFSAIWTLIHNLPAPPSGDDVRAEIEYLKKLRKIYDSFSVNQKREIEQFIMKFMWIQDPSVVVEDLHQRDVPDTVGLSRRISIPYVFTERSLLKFQEFVTRNEVVMCSSKHSNPHATNYELQDNHFWVFDSNNVSGEDERKSSGQEVAQLIKKHHFTNLKMPSDKMPLVFHSYLVSEFPSNSAQQSNIEIVRALIKADGNRNINDATQEGMTHLILAVRDRDVVMTQFYLNECKANPNLREASGYSALDYAVTLTTNRVELVKILLAANADPEAKEENSNSAFEKAIDFEYWNIVREFLIFINNKQNKEDRLSDDPKNTLVSAASRLQRWDIIAKYLFSVKSLNELSPEDAQLLKTHRKEIFKSLNNYLREVRPFSDRRRKYAEIIEGSNALTELANLSEDGIEVKAAESKEFTKLKTDFDYLNENYNSMAKAVLADDKKAAEEVRLTGDPDWVSPDTGDSLLHTMVEKNNRPMLQFLLSIHNININAKDKKNQTPLQRAINLNQWNMVHDFLEEMCKRKFMRFNFTLVSMAFKLEKIGLLVKYLENLGDLTSLSKDDIKLLQSHRKELVDAVLVQVDDMNNNKDAEARLNKIIDGKNALGMLLKVAPSPALFKFSRQTYVDDQGNSVKTTKSIVDLVKCRDEIRQKSKAETPAHSLEVKNPNASQ